MIMDISFDKILHNKSYDTNLFQIKIYLIANHRSFSYQTISIKYVNPYCNQWNVAITKIICLNSTCNLRRAYFAIKQINSISIVQKTIAKYHGNFAIKIQGPAKFTSNIQVNVSHRYIKWIILLWLLNKMENINESNWKNWFTTPILL